MSLYALTNGEEEIVEEFADAIRLAKHVASHHHVHIKDTDPNYTIAIVEIAKSIFKTQRIKGFIEQKKGFSAGDVTHTE